MLDVITLALIVVGFALAAAYASFHLADIYCAFTPASARSCSR